MILGGIFPPDVTFVYNSLINMLGPIVEIRAISANRVLKLPSGDVVSTQFKFGDGTTGSINVISATPFYGRFAVYGEQGWVDVHEMAHGANPGESHLTHCNKAGERVLKIYQLIDTVTSVRLKIE